MFPAESRAKPFAKFGVKQFALMILVNNSGFGDSNCTKLTLFLQIYCLLATVITVVVCRDSERTSVWKACGAYRMLTR